MIWIGIVIGIVLWAAVDVLIAFFKTEDELHGPPKDDDTEVIG